MIDGDSVRPALSQQTFPRRASGYYRHKGLPGSVASSSPVVSAASTEANVLKKSVTFTTRRNRSLEEAGVLLVELN